jgi:hypothetical protein
VTNDKITECLLSLYDTGSLTLLLLPAACEALEDQLQLFVDDLDWCTTPNTMRRAELPRLFRTGSQWLQKFEGTASMSTSASTDIKSVLESKIPEQQVCFTALLANKAHIHLPSLSIVDLL